MQVKIGQKVHNLQRGNWGTVVNLHPETNDITVYFHNKQLGTEANVKRPIEEFRSLRTMRKLSFYPPLIQDYVWMYGFIGLVVYGFNYLIDNQILAVTGLTKIFYIKMLELKMQWMKYITCDAKPLTVYLIVGFILLFLSFKKHFKTHK